MHRFIPVRKLSSLKKPSAAEIRQTFMDYFVKDNSHSFIKSSSVIPYGDPSVAFVNAGMNQVSEYFNFSMLS
jgi:alanyl-tRNA synthetase